MSELADEVKAAIMIEVNSQLTPLKTTVDRLDRTVRSLYSNGSGGPPGYLETARAEDKEKHETLMAVVQEHGDQLTKIADFVKTHNDRDREEQARQKKREERLRFWAPKLWQIAGALVVMFGSVIGWAYHEAAPVVYILWQDYLRSHPTAASQLKNTSSNEAEGVYAVRQQQDAATPRQP